MTDERRQKLHLWFLTGAVSTEVSECLEEIDRLREELAARDAVIQAAEDALKKLLCAAPFEGDLRLMMLSLKSLALSEDDHKYATEYGASLANARVALAQIAALREGK